ncbi:MAG: hypothetical protein AABW59_04385 [archaeon]
MKMVLLSAFDKVVLVFCIIVFSVIAVSAGAAYFAPAAGVPSHSLDQISLPSNCVDGNVIKVSSGGLVCGSVSSTGGTAGTTLPTCANGQVVKFSTASSSWVCGDDANGSGTGGAGGCHLEKTAVLTVGQICGASKNRYCGNYLNTKTEQANKICELLGYKLAASGLKSSGSTISNPDVASYWSNAVWFDAYNPSLHPNMEYITEIDCWKEVCDGTGGSSLPTCNVGEILISTGSGNWSCGTSAGMVKYNLATLTSSSLITNTLSASLLSEISKLTDSSDSTFISQTYAAKSDGSGCLGSSCGTQDGILLIDLGSSFNNYPSGTVFMDFNISTNSPSSGTSISMSFSRDNSTYTAINNGGVTSGEGSFSVSGNITGRYLKIDLSRGAPSTSFGAATFKLKGLRIYYMPA